MLCVYLCRIRISEQTGLGFAPIPEPGAATLMCLGLALLATFGRQRS